MSVPGMPLVELWMTIKYRPGYRWKLMATAEKHQGRRAVAVSQINRDLEQMRLPTPDEVNVHFYGSAGVRVGWITRQSEVLYKYIKGSFPLSEKLLSEIGIVSVRLSEINLGYDRPPRPPLLPTQNTGTRPSHPSSSTKHHAPRAPSNRAGPSLALKKAVLDQELSKFQNLKKCAKEAAEEKKKRQDVVDKENIRASKSAAGSQSDDAMSISSSENVDIILGLPPGAPAPDVYCPARDMPHVVASPSPPVPPSASANVDSTTRRPKKRRRVSASSFITVSNGITIEEIPRTRALPVQSNVEKSSSENSSESIHDSHGLGIRRKTTWYQIVDARLLGMAGNFGDPVQPRNQIHSTPVSSNAHRAEDAAASAPLGTDLGPASPSKLTDRLSAIRGQMSECIAEETRVLQSLRDGGYSGFSDEYSIFYLQNSLAEKRRRIFEAETMLRDVDSKCTDPPIVTTLLRALEIIHTWR